MLYLSKDNFLLGRLIAICNWEICTWYIYTDVTANLMKVNKMRDQKQYSGMTVNERLYASGQMDEFDKFRKSDIQKAYEILQKVELPDESIRPILNIRHEIPKSVLLDSFCNYYPRNVIEKLKEWNLDNTQIDNILNREDVDQIFAFSKNDLLEYLKSNEDISDRVINESYDKRFTPSTFISEEKNKYKVGFFNGTKVSVRTWKNKYEAVTDYLLFSWNLDRLK